MEVVFVNPPTPDASANLNSDEDEYMFPFSIIYLHNHLSKNGIASKIFDLYSEDQKTLFDYCRHNRPKIVGITAQSRIRFAAIDIIKKVREILPDSFIITGGSHFGNCPEETLTHIDEIDAVSVIGDGEHTMLEVTENVFHGTALENVNGLVYREGNKIRRTKPRIPESNLDKFDLEYKFLPPIQTSNLILLRNYEKECIKAFPIMLGRGCPSKCVFCAYNKMAYRVRSIENILNEIIFIRDTYGLTYFHFNDPSFCARKEFVITFCEYLINNNINIKWYCEARVDTPFEILELMARAGCISLDFALESGSEKVLRAIKKQIDPDIAIRFGEKCKELNIRSLVFLMVSLPTEEEKDALMTVDAAKRLSRFCSNLACACTNILPGTELEIIAKTNGILPPDFSWYDPSFIHNNTDLGSCYLPLYIENLSIDFIRSVIRQINAMRISTYYSPRDLCSLIVQGIKNIPKHSLERNINKGKVLYKVIKDTIVSYGKR